MKFFLDNLLRSPDDNGGGGGGGGDPAAAAAAAAANPNPAASPSAGDPSADAAAAAAALAAPVDLYKPEGVPDNMIGKTDRETADNMAKALKGYRERDSQNVVPDKVEAYADFGADIAPEVKPHLETLAKDPLFERMTAFALESRVPLPVFQGMTKQFLSVAAEMGMMEPPIDVAAERLALTPEMHRHLPEAEQKTAREQRMNDNFAYLDQMATTPADKGGLAKETIEHVKMMLGDTAKGHEFIEFFRAKSGGGTGPYMGGGAPNGGDPRAALAARAGLPENTWGNSKFSQASYDALQADYQKLIPND